MKQAKLILEIFYLTHSCLAQLVDHYSDDQKVMGSIPNDIF